MITGANSGIGKSAATELAKRDARIILACRDINKAKSAVVEIRKKTNKGILIIKHLDLSSLASVRTFAEDILQSENRLDVLVNNAGVFGVPRSLTEDGFESTFGINHLGHFALTNLLLDLLKSSQPSRIVVVSSMLYTRSKIDFADIDFEQKYDRMQAYSRSKVANILFAHALSKKLEGTGVTINSLSPGFVKTQLARYVISDSWIKYFFYRTLGNVFMRTPEHGCQVIIKCCLDPDLQNTSGKFFKDNKVKELLPYAKDDAVAEKLWEVSERLTNI